MTDFRVIDMRPTAGPEGNGPVDIERRAEKRALTRLVAQAQKLSAIDIEVLADIAGLWVGMAEKG